MTPGLTLTDPRPLNRSKLRFLTAGLTKNPCKDFPLFHTSPTEVASIGRAVYKSDQLINGAFQSATLEPGIAGWTIWGIAYRDAREVFA
ncbi:MAG: hypothetical protein QM706_15330 [Nitrospira sp.]